MKKIEAYIKPFKLESVKTALIEKGVSGMTIMEVQGFGRQKGHQEIYRGVEYRVDFLSKVLIQLIVEEDRVDELVEVIRITAHTGSPGDGKIIVSPLDQVMRISTGETGRDAI